MECLDEETVLALVDGRLAGGALTAAEAHVAGCAACLDLLTAAAPLAAAAGEVGDASIAAGTATIALRGASARARVPAPAESPGRGSEIGRYVVLGLVGRGGMGEVYAAYDPELDRRVALKLLAPGGGATAGIESDEARARLLREAQAIARLSHPNVVVVHDAGTYRGRVFIAMEFVEGLTLADWLKERPRAWRELQEVFGQAGRGLAAAHEAGLVHRDFKPHNVMVRADGEVRVMDFGLARSVLDPQPSPVGTPPAERPAGAALEPAA